MRNQIRYGDIEIGLELPALFKRPTLRQLVQWAGASEDFNPIHYDREASEKQALPAPIVHGPLLESFLGQMLTNWAGPHGNIRTLSVRHVGMQFANQGIWCKGKIVKKYVEGGENRVEIEIWIENDDAEKTTIGTATVVLL